MFWLLGFVLLILILQVILFFVIRVKRRQYKKESILEKYNIKSTADVFRLLQDHTIPESDRIQLEDLYKGDLHK